MGWGEILLSGFSIFMINLVLSGDNALVIGLAIRDMPKEIRKKAALLASMAAIILRILFSMFAFYLLKIRFLSLMGGIVLIWITFSLLKSGGEEETNVKGSNNFWRAVWIIIIADLSMSLDNVLGVAGAADGNLWLVIFGLVTSIPVLIFGSNWLASLINRWPIIIYIGAMILFHTAINMIINDQGLSYFLSLLSNNKLLTWVFTIPILVYGVYITNRPQLSGGERQR
jgi:YjbE family integral membrane protein